MKVEEIMNKRLRTVEPDATIKKAVDIMNKYMIGSILVVKNEQLVGIITERDILVKIVSACKDPNKTLVSDIMVKNPVTVEPEADVEAAARLMTKHKCKKLPVVHWGKLVGILTATDIVANARDVVDRILTIMMYSPEVAVDY